MTERAPDPVAAAGLAERLRRETAALHHQVERTGVMHALLHRRVDRAAYARLLRSLHAIYAALEPALAARRTDPCVAKVFDPALCRADALAADLHTLHGPHWAGELAVAPAARHYAERVAELADADPPALVAHAYVRYLGDLSGGQALRQLVADTFALPAGEGTRFYRFGTGAQTDALKRAFRAALDRLPADRAVQDTIVAEACRAFERHRQLFIELDPQPAG